MAFGGKVDHTVKIVGGKQAAHQRPVADVALHEHMAGIALHAFQVFQVSGVGELIQVYKQYILVFVQHIVYKVGADKSGAAGDEVFFHGGVSFLSYFRPFSPSQCSK